MRDKLFLNYSNLCDQHPELFSNENALIEIIQDLELVENWRKDRQEQLVQLGEPLDWADIGVVFEDPYFFIVRDLVRFANGSMNGYCRVMSEADLKGGQGVVVMPFFQGKILLLHQYRHPTRKWHYEFPRGYGEKGLAAAENAKKEVIEETGGVIQDQDIVSLGEFYNNTGFAAQAVSLFFAKLSTIGDPDANEGIESFVWLSVAELERWIADEKITDGFTIAAYTRAKLKGLLDSLEQ